MTNEERLDEINKELKKHTEQIINLEKGKITTDILVKNFTAVSKELSCTMKNIEKTMVGMQVNLKDNTQDVAKMNLNLDKLDERIRDESEKNKIDLRDVNKNKLVDNIKNYAIGTGGIFGLIYGMYELMQIISSKV